MMKQRPNTGFARCAHCGAEYTPFTTFNHNMQRLCKAWKYRHEAKCKFRTPALRLGDGLGIKNPLAIINAMTERGRVNAIIQDML
jgi:hypothetical protein